MTVEIALILGFLIGGLLGFLLTFFKMKGEKAALSAVNSVLKENLDLEKKQALELRNENGYLKAELSANKESLNNAFDKLENQKAETKELQNDFSEKFENLANKILEEKSKKFTDQNQVNINNLLNPLKEKISDFEKKVEHSNSKSGEQHAALKQQIESLQKLNMQISEEALNLTKALKGDSKTQGNWGEVILERVLEKSGLEKGREYEVQQSFTTTEGKRVLPDVVIHLPENKKIIVDSKVSLKAYEQFSNAENEKDKQQFLKAHVSSIKKHIENLSGHNYQDLYQVESPDFVVLFIPIEPAFAWALKEDNNLYTKAFEKNIIVVSPTTLLATLRTITSIWQNDKQQKNAIEIAVQAGKLHDQFVNILNDFDKIGNQISTVQKTYESIDRKFTGKGNIVKKASKLKEMGASANKNISEEWKTKSLE